MDGIAVGVEGGGVAGGIGCAGTRVVGRVRLGFSFDVAGLGLRLGMGGLPVAGWWSGKGAFRARARGG